MNNGPDILPVFVWEAYGLQNTDRIADCIGMHGNGSDGVRIHEYRLSYFE